MMESRVISSKRQLYKAAIRSGWYMPPYNSACMTVKYIMQVKHGKALGVRHEDVRVGPCPDSPPREEILNELKKIIVRFEKPPLGFKDTHAPCTDWLLNVLASNHMYHRFFHRDYVPPPRRRKN